MTTEGAIAIAADHVRKAFGATIAVDDVSFEVAAGGVHALLGENGAGKSTIVKLLSGLLTPDSGSFRIFGETTTLSKPRAAHARGIQTAFQEMTLVRDLTVLESVLLPYAPANPLGLIRRRAAEEDVRRHFAALGLDHIDLQEEVGNLDLAIKQKIEIARALYREPRILLLDEPTSSLTGRDVDWLGEMIAREKAKGVTIIFISHRLKEVRSFCDSLSILRNGQHIATGKVADFDDEEVIRMIVGRSIGQAFPERPVRTHASGPEVLRVENLATDGKLADASLSLHRGEILGVAGLQGMGQLDLFVACFGMAEITNGRIMVDGKPVTIGSPADAVRADIGISLVPEDRKTEALFLKLTGTVNASIPVIKRFSRFGLIDAKREQREVAEVFQRVDVADRALWTRAGAFSGGNQQKIAIAKWLLAQSRVLLLYDPTRGIDVGTKHELYHLMRQYVEAGGAILLYSTEIPELVHLADRVMVLYQGRVAREIGATDLSEDSIVRAALGGDGLGRAALTSLSAGVRPIARRGLRLGRYRGLLVALGVFIALLLVNDLMSPGPMSYFEFSFMSTGGAPLAIAAAGQTLVILTGGFDLSAGAVISLVNVLLATNMPDTTGGILLWSLIGIGVGMATGAFNGFFIAFFRLQPIVVTLATMFIVQGLTLLVLDKPGGMVPAGLSSALVQDAIPNFLPMPVVVLAILILLWLWLKNTRFGTAVYAIGSDMDAARAQGISVPWVQLLVYTLAGGCYGFAGVFISAQIGAGDPLIGNSMLLQIFGAVVVGGTRLGGGRGGCVGSMIGAYILMIVVNILLVLNVSAYYSTITEGCILILAVLAGSLTRRSQAARSLRALIVRIKARHHGMLPGQGGRTAQRLLLPGIGGAGRTIQLPSFFARHAEALRYAVPAYICFILVVVITELALGRALFNSGYYNSLIVLSSFLLILALGQGTVILTGGLDLSVPWTIALCGILLAGIVNGQNGPLLYALPLVLVVGCLVGLANGFGIAMLGISPIVMTLAMNGILQGIALLYSQGTPAGFSAPLMRWFMTSKSGLVTPVVVFVVLFVIAAVILHRRTPFGRRVYALGNGERVAALSGIAVNRTILLVYMLSGFCSALVGCMLTGFSGQASLGMGDDYLLPSIAVVVVGGTLITGGRGTYLGMVGGVLLLTALQTLLAGTTLPYATRIIIFGLVVLAAVVALRERNN